MKKSDDMSAHEATGQADQLEHYPGPAEQTEPGINDKIGRYELNAVIARGKWSTAYQANLHGRACWIEVLCPKLTQRYFNKAINPVDLALINKHFRRVDRYFIANLYSLPQKIALFHAHADSDD